MRSLLVSTLSLLALSFCWSPNASGQSSADRLEIPTHFQAHRIFVTPVTADGQSFRLYTDTGGGRYPILLKSTVERLDLPLVDTLSRGRRSIPLTRLPEFPDTTAFPPLRTDRVLVFPENREVQLIGLENGMLGQSWFAGRTWTFDYGAERLLLHKTSPEPPAPAHTVDLGFRTDSTGQRLSNHPRIQATIDGTTHSFLFDTGATTILTDSAQAALGGPKRRGGSFMVASLFDRLRNAHPNWRVLEGASPYRGGTPLLRIPEITIAGHTVGPVWVERRSDRAFEQMSRRSMDQPVQGALGGSLFQYFRITVNYPEAWASFERVQ